MPRSKLFYLCFLLEYCHKGCSQRNLANTDLSFKRQKKKKSFKKTKGNKGNVQLSHHRQQIRKKRAPMPLYNTTAHNGFSQHRPASGTIIHTAYSTVHVATSVTVATLHKTNSWTQLCHLYENVSMYAASVVEGGSREVFWGSRRQWWRRVIYHLKCTGDDFRSHHVNACLY